MSIPKRKPNPAFTKVTPAYAEYLLNKNTKNRSLRPGTVEAMTYDMKNGFWTRCFDPILIFITGEIASGQHRLWAIVESGMPQEFVFHFDVTPEEALNLDTQNRRTLIDNLRISGSEMKLDNNMQSMLRGLAHAATATERKHTYSHAEMKLWAEKHYEVARWVMTHSPRAVGTRSGAVTAAMGRAWYIEKDKERLAEFGKIMTTGMANGPQDSAAIALRNHLQSMILAGKSPVSTGNWRDTFLKAQNTIRYFMRRKPLNVIRNVTDEAYPLSGALVEPTTKVGERAVQRATKMANKAKGVK